MWYNFIGRKFNPHNPVSNITNFRTQNDNLGQTASLHKCVFFSRLNSLTQTDTVHKKLKVENLGNVMFGYFFRSKTVI